MRTIFRSINATYTQSSRHSCSTIYKRIDLLPGPEHDGRRPLLCLSPVLLRQRGEVHGHRHPQAPLTSLHADALRGLEREIDWSFIGLQFARLPLAWPFVSRRRAESPLLAPEMISLWPRSTGKALPRMLWLCVKASLQRPRSV